jgi:YD repeat-containing protein
VPSIIHLHSQHFSALVARRGDGYLVRDPALGGDRVLSAAALEEEATGYLHAGGLTSSLGYAADGFLQTMTTPAGTTTFRKGPNDGLPSTRAPRS